MRTLMLICLTVVALAVGNLFAVAAPPEQPTSVLPAQAQQVKYVYEDVEDDDANAAANETKQMEKAAGPTVESAEPTVESAVESSDGDSNFYAGDSCSCDSCSTCGCDDSGWCDCVGDFTLDGALGWECCPYNIGGWTEMGYTTNNVPLSQAYNDLLSFNDVPDNVNLNQQWMYIERTVDGSCGWDLGGRVDAVYGTDAQKTQAFGNPNAGVRGFGFFDASWDHNQYGFAMPQLYGEVAYHDLSVKVGHFFTPMGYEVIPATGNFFYTHSYTFFNSEPFTHTPARSPPTPATKVSPCTAVGRSAGTPVSTSSIAAATSSAAFPPS